MAAASMSDDVATADWIVATAATNSNAHHKVRFNLFYNTTKQALYVEELIHWLIQID